MKIYLANAKSRGYFSQLNAAKYFLTLDLHAGYHHIPLDELSIPKQHSHHHLVNTGALKYPLDWHEHQLIFKN